VPGSAAMRDGPDGFAFHISFTVAQKAENFSADLIVPERLARTHNDRIDLCSGFFLRYSCI
jgi:hypothetical protein